MDTPVLYHLEISHYNEKARWALDYKRVPHVRRAPPPLLHMPLALAMTGKPTLPVLELDGEAIGDSTRIIEAVERRWPEPPLYPGEPAERRRALELEELFDEELGPSVRRYLFHEVLEGLEPDDFVEGALAGSPPVVRRVMRATAPVGSRLLRLRYGIDPEGARAAQLKIESSFERLERELQPSGYLVGDRFGVADLALAALVAPIVAPEQFPYPQPQRGHPALERLRAALGENGIVEWTREMYARHRGASAEVPAGA